MFLLLGNAFLFSSFMGLSSSVLQSLRSTFLERPYSPGNCLHAAPFIQFALYYYMYYIAYMHIYRTEKKCWLWIFVGCRLSFSLDWRFYTARDPTTLFCSIYPVLSSMAAAAAKSLQSCLTLCDPRDSSPPGSPVPGILQAGTRVGWHFLLQCMKVKSESEVAQSCLTLRYPMDCSLPGSSVYGIFQARVLAWGAIAFSSSMAGR